MMKRGKVAVISGPSGVGQDTLIDFFIAKHPDWWLDISVMTRGPRPGEEQGKDAIFLDEEEFKQWENEGKFLETLHVVDHWYGTLSEPIEQHLSQGINVFIRPHPKGLRAIKKLYPDAMTIFINAESWEALEQRLRKRHTEDPEEVERRLSENKQRIKYQDEYDNVIINPTGAPEKAVAEMEKILLS